MYIQSLHVRMYMGTYPFVFCRLLPKHVDHGLEGGTYIRVYGRKSTYVQTVQLLLLATHASVLYVQYVCAHVSIVTIPQKPRQLQN